MSHHVGVLSSYDDGHCCAGFGWAEGDASRVSDLNSAAKVVCFRRSCKSQVYPRGILRL